MSRLTVRGIALALLSISPIFAQSGAWFIDSIAGATRPVTDGPAVSALLNTPGGVAIDSAGSIIFADTENHRVRRITSAGAISTIVGTGVPGNSGDGGLATAATMVSPRGLAIDSAGNLFVSDYVANVVRKIATDGTISTVAGTGLPGSTLGSRATSSFLNGPIALAVDRTGNLYIADDYNAAVRKVTPDGAISNISTTRLPYPEGLALDAVGNVYVASWLDNKIYKVNAAGAVSLYAGTGTGSFTGDGGQATAATLNSPQGIALDSTGNLWISDTGNQRIRRIGTDGVIRTMIGSGTKGLSNFSADPTGISLYDPDGIAVDSRGFVFWSEAGNNRIRNYNPGNRQVGDSAGITPPLNAAGTAASLLLANPNGIAYDSAGNLFIADTNNNVIRRITPAGAASVFAGTGQPNYNGDVGTAGAINLAGPRGVSVDAQGVVWIADTGNGRIRKVDTTGRITTVMGAGTGLPFNGSFAGNAFLLSPVAVVGTGNNTFAVLDRLFGVVERVDAFGTISIMPSAAVNFLTFPRGFTVAGNVTYVADTFLNRIIRNEGNTTTVFAGTGVPGNTGDGGPASRATLYLPTGVTVDSAGNVYIADTGNNVIRMVDTRGNISTIAGTGSVGFSGDKGAALSAQFAGPAAIQVDGSGNLSVTDQGNQRIRQLQFRQVPPDVLLTADATSKTANRGASVSFSLTVASQGGFAGSVNVTATAPASLPFRFTPAVPVTLAAGQSVVITATALIPAGTAPASAQVTFTAASGAIQKTVSATVQITSAPQFPATGVVSGASGVGGGIAPGQIVAIYGQDLGPAEVTLGAFDSAGILSRNVGNVQVTFDGVAAPILYSLGAQVSAIVPYSVAGKATTQVQVTYAGQRSATASVPVVDAAPALFNIPGESQAVAQNADFSLNNAGNAAAPGSIVVLYGTGEGVTDPGGVDGKQATETFPKPVLPVSVTIGGEAAEVLYAGAAPCQVAGLMQLNVRVPAGARPGAVPVVVTVGTRRSSGTSTIAVK